MARDPAYDLVALTGSAGGLAAALEVLRVLPKGFSVPLAMMLHLAPEVEMPEVLQRLPFEVEWACEGSMLRPGTLLLCPPRTFVELLPDGSCVLSPCERGALDRPIDRLLVSIARSFGHRAIAIVLTGMGDDAAAGAVELRRSGGCVLVQSAASADQPSMPKAAIAAGAAAMVLPLAELGHVIGELVAGVPRKHMRAEVDAIRRVFGDHGEVAAQARELDWSRTALGAVMGWPEELRVMARTAVDSTHPEAVWWGPELTQVYNDAWGQFLGVREHPQALGRRAHETWPQIWHEIGPMVERVMAQGVAVGGEDFPLLVDRDGYTEEVFATFSYSPIRNAAGAVAGVHNTVWETTRNVVAERRLKALRTLTAQMAEASDIRDACERAAAALASAPQDAPFALLYLVDERRRQATLAGAAGVEPGSPAAPRVLALAGDAPPWPLLRVLAQAQAGAWAEVLLDDLAQRCPGLPPTVSARAGTLSPGSALLLPLRLASGQAPAGVLVLGLNPHRPRDEAYRSFIDLVAAQAAAGVAVARAKELECERRERLAELDRAKTEFFADVSHEFRTPLTLLLAPLEELLRRRELLPAQLGDELDTAARNARRLLTLVTNLLDFSQIESHRQRAQLIPHDLCALTTDIASHFRSAIEAAGLRLRVDCAPSLPPVPVDPEMWTKVVSNLLSNAFKFTFEGEISVVLSAFRLHAQVVVADTGAGIPEHELPNVFKRFHRVRGTRARTAEGAGIGLSIVQDLVSRMGGQLQMRSRQGQGTFFTIWLPYKTRRGLGEPQEPSGPGQPPAVAADLAEEAARWLPQATADPAGTLDDLLGPPSGSQGPVEAAAARGRILVVDDNADMRDFLRRLLGSDWEVDTAADGESGLAAARHQRPVAILADVMMPAGLDGFELLRRLRADPQLQHIPVVLVTARAGEAAAIEGLMAGADDYIAKPFSPHELVARVRAVIGRARADVALRESEARLTTVFQALPVGVGVLNPAGTLVLCNKEMQRFAPAGLIPARDDAQHWRWSARDADGRVIEPQDFPGARALRGESVIPGIEMLYRQDDGSQIWTAVAAVPIKDTDQRLTGAFAVVSDIDRLKRTAEALQASEARQAYLLALSDALRPLGNAEAVKAAAARVLGERLQANRVFYAEVEGDGWLADARFEHGVAPVPVAQYAAGANGPRMMQAFQAGHRVVWRDVERDLEFSTAERAAYLALEIAAVVGVPLVKEGRLIAALIVHSAGAREWLDDEVQLIEDTAERTWSAVARARTEAALRESERKYRMLFDSIQRASTRAR